MVKAAAPPSFLLLRELTFRRVVAARLSAGVCASAACFPPSLLGGGRGSPTATVVTAGCAFVGAGRAAVSPAGLPSRVRCGALLRVAPFRPRSPASSSSPRTTAVPWVPRGLYRQSRADTPFVFFSWSRLASSPRSLHIGPPPVADGCDAVHEPASRAHRRARTRGVGILQKTRLSRIGSRGCSISPGPHSVKRVHLAVAMAAQPLLRAVQ